MKTQIILARIGLVLLVPLLTAPLNTAAQTISEFPIAVGPDTCFTASAAYNGSTYLVPIVGDNSSSHSLTVQLVSTSGALIGDRLSLGSESQQIALAASDGNGFLVCWNDRNTRLWGRLISADGSPQGEKFLIANYGWIGNNSLAFGGNEYCIIYEDTLTTQNHACLIYARFITTSGVVGSPIQISQSEGFLDGGLAFDGNTFLAAWRGGGEYTPIVYGRLFNSNGTAGGTLLIDDSSYNSDNPVSVAWDGTRYLVAFGDEVDENNNVWNIYGRFVTPAGQVQDRISIADNGNYNFPFVAFNGNTYLVTCHHIANFPGNQVYLRGRYFDTAGTAVGDELAIASPLNGKIPIGGVMLFDGTNFVVGVNRVSIHIESEGDFEFTNGDVYGILISSSPSGVTDSRSVTVPNAFILRQNYPNPFNPSTIIPYQLSEPADVTISIFDIRGAEVMRYRQSGVPAGSHRVQWDSRNSDGKQVPAGVYTYRLEVMTAAGIQSDVKKMILLK